MGTAYSGWQRQDTAISIQQVMEESMTKLFSDNIYIVGCGRTDSGVHASQYYFHVDIDRLPDYDLQWRLNKMLPDDIAIHDIIEVTDTASARFDAISRQYVFHIHTIKNPFLFSSSVYVDTNELNLDKMNSALNFLTKQTDFSAFCRTPDRHNTCICHIDLAIVNAGSKSGTYKITIRGNRFLRAMIRIITHRVILIGTEKLSLEDFKKYFSEGNQGEQVVLMPPQGLFLDEIKYPYSLISTV